MSWWIGINQMRVLEDLQGHPELEVGLSGFHKAFVRWAAKERLTYEADIIDEVGQFSRTHISQRLYSVNVELWGAIRRFVFERDDYTCLYCHIRGGELEVDHKIPISRGGTNDLLNLATSCLHCNRSKRNLTAEEFIQKRLCQI
jgi:hypothetical protein